MFKITLPMPPSVNCLYAGKKRRYKSPRYKAWIKEAAVSLYGQPIASISVPVEVEYTFGKPDKRKRDVENYIKATSDFLVEYGILTDDSLIDCLITRWGKVVGVEIVIKPCPKMAEIQD